MISKSLKVSNEIQTLVCSVCIDVVTDHAGSQETLYTNTEGYIKSKSETEALLCVQELEQELTEQRGLTQAIIRHGSRARLHSQDSEDLSQLSLWYKTTLYMRNYLYLYSVLFIF